MWQDPIVEEVRKHRAEIELECKNDFDKLFELATKTQSKLTKRLVSRPTTKIQTEPATSESDAK